MIQLSIAVVTASASGLFRSARCHDAALAVARRLHLLAPAASEILPHAFTPPGAAVLFMNCCRETF
jgi:hypothetical protein